MPTEAELRVALRDFCDVAGEVQIAALHEAALNDEFLDAMAALESCRIEGVALLEDDG